MKSTELFDRYLASCTPEERERALDVVEKVEFICKLRGVPNFGPESAIDLVVCLARWKQKRLEIGKELEKVWRGKH